MLAQLGLRPWYSLAGILLALFSTIDLSAYAQAPGSPGPPPPRQERPDTRTPSARQAESYDPSGVRLGSFRLYPVLELDEVYNDNVYAAPSGNGQTGSFLQVIKPSVEMRSTWSTHMLNLFARGGFGIYGAAPSLNYQDFSVGGDGRLDIQRNWNTYGTLSFSRLHEDPGLPNTVSGVSALTVYNQATGSVGYYQKFARLSGRLDFRADNFNYTNNGLGLANGVVPNADRDRTELRESLRVGHEFLDGYEVWVRGGLNQRLYVNAVDAAGFARNSSGWDMVGGISIDVGGLTTAEVFAGYLQQNYVDSRFQTLQGVQFGATAYWNPLKELVVKPYVRRTVNEAAYVGDSGYLGTSLGVDLNYNLRPNIRLDGRGDYSIADYQNSSTSNRYDQYVAFSAGVMYLPVAEFYVGPRYQYIHRSSNQPGLDYSQNLIMLRLGARL